MPSAGAITEHLLPVERQRHILFLGSGESTLHLMAEALARRILAESAGAPGAEVCAPGEASPQSLPAPGEEVRVVSACMTPFGVDPLAAEVMGEVGLDIRGLSLYTPEDVDVFLVDLVVTLGDFDQSCRPRMPGMPPHLHWDIPEPPRATPGDPASLDTRRAGFRRARAALEEEIGHLVARGFFRALFTSRKNFELILDNLLDGVMAHTFTRRIFYFNEAAEEITGLGREEVLGRDCHEVFPGRFCGGDCFFCQGATPQAQAAAQAAAQAGQGRPRPRNRSPVVETVFRRPDGDERLLEMRPAPLMDAEGVDVGALISFKDISELAALRKQARHQHSLSGIVGRDPKMLALFDLIEEVGAVPVSVLIEGESGTGKEVVANAIHNVSPRAEKPFVAVNCGALPEGVLESELFGHVKGAFTGAVRDKKGRFELAQGGTIFLDEVGEISPLMQVSLLRVLQERSVQPVGGERSIDVDVRVISATNQSLRSLMEKGRFRPDLFYRLCVVPMTLPPLRERRLDIPLLVGHFLDVVARETGRDPKGVSPDALDRLTRYLWPGNVRELRNAIEYAYVKCHGGTIEPEHLPPEIRSPAPHWSPPGPGTGGGTGATTGAGTGASPSRLSPEAIEAALTQAGGNKKKAAALLGVGRATLYRHLRNSAQKL